jgi:hypothetical protein
MNRIEDHLFACADCTARMEQLVALGAGVAILARRGRINGVVSRALVNRLQRDGVHVRVFSLVPGETVPCAVFPGDELLVASLRADFSGVHAVTLSVTGPDDAPFGRYADVPVSAPFGEVLWATSAAIVERMPTMRLDISLTSAGADATELGRYTLEHSART